MAIGPNPDKPTKSTHYFVDEAGDGTLFDARGNVIVGQPGCSRYFILGVLKIEDPVALRCDLEGLRTALLADPYFDGVPSMQLEQKKTALAFHAKDDLPEVRREVFSVLLRHRGKFHAVIHDKTRLVEVVKQRNRSNPAYRYRENELYDDLVTHLFTECRFDSGMNDVRFSKRGKKDRTMALRRAISNAESALEADRALEPEAGWAVSTATPREDAILQAADYYLWAYQRYFERGEERYMRLLKPNEGAILLSWNTD